MKLVQIRENGSPAEHLELPETAKENAAAVAGMYKKTGFTAPWTGYFAVADGTVVGTCLFRSAPVNGRVEIAYFTSHGCAGRGYDGEMVRQLVGIVNEHDPSVQVFVRTPPQESDSSAMLEKLGFKKTGTVVHPMHGDVWEWVLGGR